MSAKVQDFGPMPGTREVQPEPHGRAVQYALRVCLVASLPVLLFAVTSASDGARMLWDLPGKTTEQLLRGSKDGKWDLPSNVNEYINRDFLMMTMVTVTLLLGALASVRRFTFEGWAAWATKLRSWHVVAAIAATLGYLASDIVETRLLRDIAATARDGRFTALRNSQVREMADWHNAKWLLLSAAAVLTISLWNHRVPGRPRTLPNQMPTDWYASDRPPGTTARPGELSSQQDLPGDPEWNPSSTRFGISVSGGGIRSASFAFGVIELLRERGLLKKARYITSVSGGSYATCALEQANRRNLGAQASTARLRRRLNYLLPRATSAFGAVARMLLGLLINLWILYLLIFMLARPVGWLIGSPQVQGGLRLDQPFVNKVVHDDDDPDNPSDFVQPWEKQGCDLHLSPDAPPSARFDRVTVGDSAQVTFEIVAHRQCVRIRHPDGDEHLESFRLATKTRGVLVFEDGDAKIVRQPVLEPYGVAKDGTKIADLVDVKVPTIDVSERAQSVDPSVKVLSLIEQPTAVEVTGVSIVDRRSGLDIDTKDWLIPVIALGVAIILWIIGGHAGVNRRLETLTRRWLQNLIFAVPGLIAGAAAGSFAALLALPWLIEVLPGTFVASESNASTFGDNAVSWLPSSIPPIAAWPVLGVVSVMRFVKGNRSAKPAAPKKRNAAALTRKLFATLRNVIVALVLASLAIVSATSIMTTGALNGPFGSHAWISKEFIGFEISWPPDLVLWTGAALFLMLIALWFPAGSWSLGTYYRQRLRWAFTGDPRTDSNGDRFDGSVPKTNEPNKRSGYVDGEVGDGTELVICCAANVLGPDRAPTGRRAVSFSASREWIGGPELGWVPTSTYIKRMGNNRERDVTISAMTALSGAAVSPAMGKGSLGPIGTVLAILNVRLGGWLPHPGAVTRMEGRTTPLGKPDRWNHTPGWPYFVREVFRRHRHESPYVYVSDGGHWENLGLVEALRRGCNTIVAISASGDGTFSHSTIAEAVEIARTDLGIEITLDEVWSMRPAAGGDPADQLPSDRQFVLQDGDNPTLGRAAPIGFTYGTFRRADVERTNNTGQILLIEATMIDRLPMDVHAYAEIHHEFPDVNTGDQFFTNRDFEAYRLLGRTIVQQAFKGARGKAMFRRIDECQRSTPPVSDTPSTPTPTPSSPIDEQR